VKVGVLVSILTIAIPIAMALWTNSRSNDRLQRQLDVAASTEISTMYANQNAPGTFWTTGAQQSV
jgi:hypothetical protein